jgi:hypothetical protein
VDTNADQVCPCGEPAEMVMNGLPVCQRCYHDALECEGSIMPGVGAIVARRGDEMWRLPMTTKQRERPPPGSGE